jgi:hypothetical protein
MYKKLFLFASFYIQPAEKTIVTLNIYLIFDKRSVKIITKRFLRKFCRTENFDNGDKIAMAAVLIGPQEVLVIMIVTAIVVLLLVRGRKHR